MNSLDKHHVEIIESDVESARLVLTNLSQELVDHICCEVEHLMEKEGKSFDEAYNIIKEQTGIKVLQKIQENTLYLIDKKYAIMKTTMKITGNIALALLGTGTVLKIFHWPGANITLIVGFVLLCLFLFPAAIYINNREAQSKRNPVLNFSILAGGIALMAGILFKVMHWPGATPLLLAGWSIILGIFLPILLFVKLKTVDSKREKNIYVLGIISLMIFEASTMFKMFHWPGAGPLLLIGSIMLVGIFLPLFTYQKFKSTEKITGQFIFLIITSMYAVIFTSLLAMNLSSDILRNFTGDEPNASQITRYLEKKKNSQLAVLKSTPDSLRGKIENRIADISRKAAQLQTLISEIKISLVQNAERVDKQTALARISDPRLMERKDNYDVVNMYMMGNDGFDRAGDLKKEIEKFRESALQDAKDNPALSESIGLLLNTNAPANESWEEKNFRNNMLISAVSLLGEFEKNVKVVETETIGNILK